MINFFYPASRITYNLNMVDNKYDMDVIKYAIESFGFIVQKRISLSLLEFANKIKENFDIIDNIQNKEVLLAFTPYTNEQRNRIIDYFKKCERKNKWLTFNMDYL